MGATIFEIAGDRPTPPPPHPPPPPLVKGVGTKRLVKGRVKQMSNLILYLFSLYMITEKLISSHNPGLHRCWSVIVRYQTVWQNTVHIGVHSLTVLISDYPHKPIKQDLSLFLILVLQEREYPT